MFSVALFNAQLKAQGQAVQWRPAAICPCRNVADGSGSPRPACPTCNGKGQVWGSATAAWTGVAGQKQVREWAKFGAWESGDEVLSIPSDSPLYAIGENDRVLMTQSTEPFSIVLERTGAERIAFPVVSLSRVFWLDPMTQLLVEGDLPTVNPDGTLTWSAPKLVTDAGLSITTDAGVPLAVVPVAPAGPGLVTDAGLSITTDAGVPIGTVGAAPVAVVTPPAVGSDAGSWHGTVLGEQFIGPGPFPVELIAGRPSSGQYSVTGRRNPEFFCFRDLPIDRAHYQGQALPRRVVLRRFDLFGK